MKGIYQWVCLSQQLDWHSSVMLPVRKKLLSPLSVPLVPLLLFPYKLLYVFGSDTVPAGKWKAVKAVRVRFCHWGRPLKWTPQAKPVPPLHTPSPVCHVCFVSWCLRKEEDFLVKRLSHFCISAKDCSGNKEKNSWHGFAAQPAAFNRQRRCFSVALNNRAASISQPCVSAQRQQPSFFFN